MSPPPAAPAAPGPLAILTSDPLPAGTVGVNYDVTLAPNGGAPPYTWSLATGSPALPNGLTFTPASGKILGVPTTATGTILTEFKLQDSKGQSVQKHLSITVNASPTPLTILTSSPLPSGSINQPYAIALSGTGGTTHYTWGLKAGSPPLPSGLSLDPSGVLSGTPAVTSNISHTFILTDATLLTVEKTLALTISAVPLSITTASLPQGTANQNYSAQLVASGGTGAYTWGLAGGSPTLPTGLTLDTSTGAITGLPTGISNQNITFTVTDQTPPTPQTATKTLQLIVGAAPPTLTITTPGGSSLPSGSVGAAYNTSLIATGGSGAHSWSIISGTLPNGLFLAPSTGAITGTPQVGSNGTIPLTVQVQDSGAPQQTATKLLSITINLPAAPNITTTSLPAGSFNGGYNQTVGVSGGIGTLVWGVTSGALPPGLGLNASNGNISGTPTTTGSFQFTLRVTDQVPQFDEQVLTITIAPPAPPQITTSSLPNGTVTQNYPLTILQASGGTAPLIWEPVVQPALPSGLSWDASSHTITGMPLNGSQGTTSHIFTVRDSTVPFQTATRSLSITISLPAPPNITTLTLPNGTVTTPYSQTVMAAGGTGALTWTIQSGSLPPPLAIDSITGVISGTPNTAGPFTFTVRATDTLNQFDDQPFSITIGLPAPPNITTALLPTGTAGTAYNQPVQVLGGIGALTWTITIGGLPPGLDIDSATGVISGVPTTAGLSIFTVKVTDTILQFDTRTLSIVIIP